MRIVSLGLAVSEILDALGLADQVVGSAVATNGFALDLEADATALQRLEADLVICQDLPPYSRVSIETVAISVAAIDNSVRPRLIILRPRFLADLLWNLKTVGDFTGSQRAAQLVMTALRTRIDQTVLTAARQSRIPRVVCLANINPPTVAGYWMPECIGLAGGVDSLAQPGLAPRITTWGEISSCRPDVLLLVDQGQSEPNADLAAKRRDAEIAAERRLARDSIVLSVENALVTGSGITVVDVASRLSARLRRAAGPEPCASQVPMLPADNRVDPS